MLSDTGAADSAGVYVLMGQAELGVPEYHQFLATDTRDPLAVTATQLDGAGGLDLVLFAVDYASPGAYTDNESYLSAFLASGAQLSEPPLVNHLTAGGELNYLFPRTEGEEAGVVAARIDPDATVPGIAVFHERGSFAIVRPSWDSAMWASATPLELQYTYAATGAAAFPSEATGVDDLIAFTDSMPQMTWLVNDGSGSFSERTVEGVAPGVALGVLAELIGAAPPDIADELRVFAVDGQQVCAVATGGNFADCP